jgi:hypothetical protein
VPLDRLLLERLLDDRELRLSSSSPVNWSMTRWMSSALSLSGLTTATVRPPDGPISSIIFASSSAASKSVGLPDTINALVRLSAVTVIDGTFEPRPPVGACAWAPSLTAS